MNSLSVPIAQKGGGLRRVGGKPLGHRGVHGALEIGFECGGLGGAGWARNLRLRRSAARPMELVRSSVSIVGGLPCEKVRSAPAIVVSGPAQRSLTLWPARSPSRLATLSIESSDSFVASAAASIATGWSEPVPGRELHPLKSSAFHGARSRQLT